MYVILVVLSTDWINLPIDLSRYIIGVYQPACHLPILHGGMEVDITWFYRMWNKQRPGNDQNGILVFSSKKPEQLI